MNDDQVFVPGCDAPPPRPVYVVDMANGEPVYGCRCLVCGRYGHHTGNSNQGHYWRFCQVTGQYEQFHYCCPDACQLTAEVAR